MNHYSLTQRVILEAEQWESNLVSDVKVRLDNCRYHALWSLQNRANQATERKCYGLRFSTPHWISASALMVCTILMTLPLLVQQNLGTTVSLVATKAITEYGCLL